MTVVLTEEVAPVRLSGDVEDVVLKINGQLANLPSDGILNLPLRASVLRVEKPGFEVWEQEVSPTRAYQREIRITLVPVQEEKTPPEAPENPQGSREAVVRNTLGIEMVRMNVPMEGAIGAPRGTPGRRTQEAVRKVRLERPFRLAATEVSNAQFARFDPSHSSGTAGSLNLGAPDLPVVRVRWEQAVQFCNWLSTQEGLPPAYVEKDGRWEIEATPGTGYRLPTEAEWEMSMRLHAGGTLYAWGDKMPPPANTVHLAGKESAGVVSTVFQEYEDGARGPVAVAEAYPGPERILGLAGNVREWVHDAFSAPVSGRTLLVDPMGDGGGRFHVMKGAGWRDGRWMDVRIAKRGYGETAADDLGFRVARYVNP